MIKGKKKGSKYELDIVQFFRELGYVCSTSRYSSRELDDAKVDIFGIAPWNVQGKAVEKLPKSYHAILAEMPKDSNYNLLFHKKNRQGTVVSMELDTFKEILQMLISGGMIKVNCTGDQVDFLAETGIEL